MNTAHVESSKPQLIAGAMMHAPEVVTDKALNVFSDQMAFESGQRMAKALASSTLVPKEYQGNIPNVLIAMEAASRIGASVFAVMQNLDIIHGRPSWRATFLIATVNACGRFSPLRFRFQGKEGTDGWGCRAVARDRESGEECLGTLITVGLARSEGWTSKNGSKWKTMPEQMLCYRAAAFWTRVYAPELSLGMQTAEEVADVHGVVGGYVPSYGASSSFAEPPAAAKSLEEQLLAKPDVEPKAPESKPADPVVETPAVDPTANTEPVPEPEAKPLTDEEKAALIDAGAE